MYCSPFRGKVFRYRKLTLIQLEGRLSLVSCGLKRWNLSWNVFVTVHSSPAEILNCLATDQTISSDQANLPSIALLDRILRFFQYCLIAKLVTLYILFEFFYNFSSIRGFFF